MTVVEGGHRKKNLLFISDKTENLAKCIFFMTKKSFKKYWFCATSVNKIYYSGLGVISKLTF